MAAPHGNVGSGGLEQLPYTRKAMVGANHCFMQAWMDLTIRPTHHAAFWARNLPHRLSQLPCTHLQGF